MSYGHTSEVYLVSDVPMLCYRAHDPIKALPYVFGVGHLCNLSISVFGWFGSAIAKGHHSEGLPVANPNPRTLTLTLYHSGPSL